jgi:hypothetical protein
VRHVDLDPVIVLPEVTDSGNASSMNYTCSGTDLDLYSIPPDPTIAPIVLTRVKS